MISRFVRSLGWTTLLTVAVLALGCGGDNAGSTDVGPGEGDVPADGGDHQDARGRGDLAPGQDTRTPGDTVPGQDTPAPGDTVPGGDTQGGEEPGPVVAGLLDRFGAQIALPGGGTLTVPEGAVEGMVYYFIQEITPPADAPFTPVGPFHRFWPEGLAFEVAVEIKVPIDEESVAEGSEDLVIAWTEPDVGWIGLDTEYDEASGIASAAAFHFSYEGIVKWPDAPSLCSQGKCPTCCTGDGKCIAGGETPTACGKDGAPCQACEAAQDCIDGKCIACHPGVCEGCCGMDTCYPGTSRFGCGNGGVNCVACKEGEACIVGYCLECEQACKGCCSDSACHGGNLDTACGADGGPCEICDSEETCVNGTCLTCHEHCAGCCTFVSDTCIADGATNNAACGMGGATCQACVVEECIAGVCTPMQDCTTASDCPAAGQCRIVECNGGKCDYSNKPDKTPCDLGDPCFLANCLGGICGYMDGIDCSDGNVCTADYCVAGICMHDPISGVACDDGEPCTENDQCMVDGSCAGNPMQCPEGLICEVGVCVCKSDCAGKECGDDGCGSVCGVCVGEEVCSFGKCVTPGEGGACNPSLSPWSGDTVPKVSIDIDGGVCYCGTASGQSPSAALVFEKSPTLITGTAQPPWTIQGTMPMDAKVGDQIQIAPTDWGVAASMKNQATNTGAEMTFTVTDGGMDGLINWCTD